MKARRNFIKKLGGLTALAAFTSANQSAIASNLTNVPGEPPGVGGGFVHMVFFWLVDESMPTRGKFVTEVMKYTSQIDVIKTRHIGRAAGTHRDVVDNSYSYCLIATFDSKADHDTYQEHPLHKQFIENASSLWTRVQVYDSVKCSTNPSM